MVTAEKFSSESSQALDEILNLALADSNKSAMTGWLKLPHETIHLKQSSAWAKSIKKTQNHLCVIGIGGSALGTQAIYDFLQPKRRVSFLSNVDGFEFERILSSFDLKKTHFLAVSKSGETSETLVQLAHILQLLQKKKKSIKDHVSVVTEDKPSSLRSLGIELRLRFLPVPLDVGGRFSVLSNVGLAPLVWAGVNVRQILEGAKSTLDSKSEIASLSDFYLKSFEDKLWISVFWIYCESLKTFGLWIEQLWSESLAKSKALNGKPAPQVSTPLICYGSNDQHSLLQQFVEGARDKSFLFIRNLESEKSQKITKIASAHLKLFGKKSVGEVLKLQVQATKLILTNCGIPTSEIKILDHRPQTIGKMIFFFELLVTTMATRIGINAYDQPGVEDVKKVVLGSLGDLRYAEQALKSED